MDRTLRWGLIGCGDVTEVKSGPALQRAEGSQLVAVASRHPRTRRRLGPAPRRAALARQRR